MARAHDRYLSHRRSPTPLECEPRVKLFPEIFRLRAEYAACVSHETLPLNELRGPGLGAAGRAQVTSRYFWGGMLKCQLLPSIGTSTSGTTICNLPQFSALFPIPNQDKFAAELLNLPNLQTDTLRPRVDTARSCTK